MIKYSLKSIVIMLECAKFSTIFKLSLMIITAIMTPLSFYFTQRLIDSIEPFVNGSIDFWYVCIWAFLLITSMFFIAGSSFFDGLINIRMKRDLNKNFTPIILNKFKNIEYSCFEDRNVADTLNRMGDSPQEKILNIFLNTTNVIALFFSILGVSLIFLQVSLWFSITFYLVLMLMLLLNSKEEHVKKV